MSAFAQTISADRMVNWSFAGLRQTFQVTHKVNVKTFGAKGDGLSDDTQAVKKALASLKTQGSELYFPKGSYLIREMLTLSNGVVINGEGSTNSHLIFDSGTKSMNCLQLVGRKGLNFTSLTQVPKKGDSNIKVKDVSKFKQGDFIELRQANGSWDKKPRDWADFAVGQILKVVKISGSTLFVDRPIRIDYDKKLNPEVATFEPLMNAGVQNISIDRMNFPKQGTNVNFNIKYAVNCWVKGVEGKKSVGSHVLVSASSNIEISGCYFHHAFDYSGSATKGYGVALLHHSGECLVVNNVFQHLRHSMMVKQGANGNVFAYNYSFEPTRKEFISNYSGDISLHGHFPFANLFEGNVVQNIMVDQYWGESGPDNTIFRNRVELYGIIYAPKAGNDHNIVGNEITNTSFLMGKLFVPGSGHFFEGNALRKKGDRVKPQSLYYKTKPSFWNKNLPFPAIGEPNSFNENDIPALKRVKEEKVWTVKAK